MYKRLLPRVKFTKRKSLDQIRAVRSNDECSVAQREAISYVEPSVSISYAEQPSASPSEPSLKSTPCLTSNQRHLLMHSWTSDLDSLLDAAVSIFEEAFDRDPSFRQAMYCQNELSTNQAIETVPTFRKMSLKVAQIITLAVRNADHLITIDPVLKGLGEFYVTHHKGIILQHFDSLQYGILASVRKRVLQMNDWDLKRKQEANVAWELLITYILKIVRDSYLSTLKKQKRCS